MDIGKFSKTYWHILIAIITVIFIVGTYYAKIDYMSKEIANNSQNIENLNKTVYVLLGTIQSEYPYLNLTKYIKTSVKHKVPTETTIEGLSILKNSNLNSGISYLMQHQNFTKEQATGVFQNSKMQNE